MADTAPSGSIKAGGAYVEIFTVDGPFHKDLARARKKLQSFSDLANKAGGKLAALGAATTAAFGGSLVASAKMFADAGGAIDDMSQRTGIAVGEISKLGYAAKLSGTSIETLESGIKKMQQALTSADEESKSAQENLKNLGLSVDDLIGLSPDQQFRKIAEAISKIPDPTRRAALAMKIFGGSGQELVPLLSQGAAGLARLGREAEALGLVWDDKTIASAAELGDAFDRLELAGSSLAVQVGGALAPEMTQLAEAITSALPQIVEFVKANKDNIVFVAKLGAATTALGVSLLGASSAANSMATAAGMLAKHWPLLIANWQIFVGLGLAAVVVGITHEIYQQVVAERDLNSELERQIKLREQLGQSKEAGTAKIVKASQKHGGSDRYDFLQQEIKRELKDLDAQEKNLKRLQVTQDQIKEVKDRHGQWKGRAEQELRNRGLLSDDTEFARADRDDAKALVESTRKRLDTLQAEVIALRSGEGRDTSVPVIGQQLANQTYVQEEADKALKSGLMTPLSDFLKQAVIVQRREAYELKQALEQEAADLEETLLSPAEKLQKKLEHLKTLREHGLSEETFAKAEKQARLEAGIETAHRNIPTLADRAQNAAAVERGSQEAFSAMVKAMNGRQDIEAQIEKNTLDTARETKLLAKTMKRTQKDQITIKQLTMA